jgi:hypothetical protein
MDPSDLSSRLIPLPDGRPGLRSCMQIETREPSDPASGIQNPGSCVLDFISSDQSLDRYSEIISASGWKLDNYQRNPVFQNAHQYGDILHTLGRAITTEVRGGTSSASPHLYQRIQFATDVNPMAKIAYGLYRGKFLNAVSVGFVPVRWKDGTLNPEGITEISPGQTRNECRPGCEVQNEHSPSASGAAGEASVKNTSNCGWGEVASSIQRSTKSPRRIYLEQELLEVSAVAIPANPNALALALKSGAIEKSDLKDLVDLFRSSLAAPKSDEGGSPIKDRESSIQNPKSARLFRALQTVNRVLKS